MNKNDLTHFDDEVKTKKDIQSNRLYILCLKNFVKKL